MARMGEGDKRWIVEDRPDGANVHNWHWAETDCLEWSRNFFNKTLSNQILLNGEGNLFVKIKNVEKLDGEAYVNVRKAKTIPGYELNLVISWEGEAKDSGGNSVAKSEGSVDIPYISDENADEDPELRVTVKDDGPIGKRLKDAFLAKGKPFVLEQVRAYVSAMAKGGPAKEELEVKKVVNKGDKAAAAPVVEKKEVVQKEEKKKKKKKKKKKEGFKTITMTEKFSCRARDLFEILMDENRWKGFTQSNARISKEVNGEFSIFDGSVTGTNVELQEGKLIVQKWRFGSWPDGIHSLSELTIEAYQGVQTPVLSIKPEFTYPISDCLRGQMTDAPLTNLFHLLQVRLTFDEPEPGVTIVKLIHSDVPEEDRYGNATVVENTERGWRDLIFHKIRAVFGFGI